MSYWNKASVTSVLRSEAVIGRTVFNRYDKTHGKRLKSEDEWIRVDSHEPVVDIGSWQIVQEMMDEGMQPANTGSPKSQHLFTGLCRCAKCGSVMQAKSSRGGKYYYYECRAKEKYGSCDQKGIRLDKLEKLLVDTLCKRVFNPDSLKKIVNEINELYVEYNKDNSQQWQKIECQLKTLDKDINNLLDVLQVVGTTKDGSQEIIERLKVKTLEKNKLESVMSNRISRGKAGKGGVILDNDIPSLSEFLIKSMNEIKEPARIRQFFSAFIEKVLVSEVQIELLYKSERIMKPTSYIGVPSMVGKKFSWLPGTGSNRRPTG
ncbi:hypothetical protein THII_2257 [Thioploca ingrica]|uniref:Recombinase zinc beta ribbon domain-containing protein n=1 Tax=Thioploca ingrica TaxID=40754 RepID=A0A090AH49_9GAMM|nr:hypothetical protein THII_2257 [Thioploca ingrica]